MRRRQKQLTTLILPCILLCMLIGGVGIWLHVQRRQYALNRQLIAALTNQSDRRAMELVNAGADPNTRYLPSPAPSLRRWWELLFHRTPAPANTSPTALLIGCGAFYQDDDETVTDQSLARTGKSDADAAVLVRAMIAHHANLDTPDSNGDTPLAWAIARNYRRTAQVLIAAGANVNARTEEGNTPLLMVTGSLDRRLNFPPYQGLFPDNNDPEETQMVRLLLEHGTDVHASSEESGRTALHLAAEQEHVEVVKMLIRHGADVDARDQNAQTPLFLNIGAATSADIPRQLLEHGADPNLMDVQGDNAFWIAQKHANHGVMALLLRYGAHRKPHHTVISVPQIARMFGVQVGYNGQKSLDNLFGEGMHTVGGHPGGRQVWTTQSPAGQIDTDGFSYNSEGLALESLSWGLASPANSLSATLQPPLVRRLPKHAGWLGAIIPGMTATQVAQWTANRLPPPQRQGDTWTWKARGFVRPSPVNGEIFTTWTAQLTFANGILTDIHLDCSGSYLPP